MSYFPTDKDAETVLKDVVGDVDIFATIEAFKTAGYISDGIVEKVEKLIRDKKNEVRNLSKREDLLRYLEGYVEITDMLYEAVQYLKSELQDVKSK